MAKRSVRKQELREHIIHRAMRLFVERGFDQTTVEEIAREARVSARTCFRHFPSKQDLAFPYHKERVERFRELLAEHFVAENPIQGLRNALLAFAVDYTKNAKSLLTEWRFVTASPNLCARDIELDREYEQAIAETIMRGRFSEEEAKVLAGTMFWSIRTAMQQWFLSDCQRDLLQIGGVTFKLLEWLSEAYKEHQSIFPEQGAVPALPQTASKGKSGGHRK